MIDFDKGDEKLNKFFGSERKTTVVLDNEVYMIKYPDPVRDLRNALSYMNNQYSAHIGCRIFRACGIEAQETALGYFTDMNGERKIVVGCKDFTQGGGTLHEFSKLGSQIITDGAIHTTIENVKEIIIRSKLIRNKDSILDSFWDMFVIDTLLANPDRHLDNWGVLERNGDIAFSPVYDCGSSLSALLDDGKMEELLLDPTGFKNHEYNVTSCYTMNGKRIFYHEIHRAPPHELMVAVKRTVPSIDMDKVCDIVDSAATMPYVRKEYLKKAMALRYDDILLPALKRSTAHNATLG